MRRGGISCLDPINYITQSVNNCILQLHLHIRGHIKTKNRVISATIRWFMPFLRSAHTGAHFIKMNSSPRKVAINKGYDGDDPTMQKPVHLKEIRNNSKEDDGQVGAEVDSPNTIYETLEGGSNGVKRSNWRYMGLVIIACLISVVALFLSLLMVSEKGSRKCDCSRNEG